MQFRSVLQINDLQTLKKRNEKNLSVMTKRISKHYIQSYISRVFHFNPPTFDRPYVTVVFLSQGKRDTTALKTAIRLCYKIHDPSIRLGNVSPFNHLLFDLKNSEPLSSAVCTSPRKYRSLSQFARTNLPVLVCQRVQPDWIINKDM